MPDYLKDVMLAPMIEPVQPRTERPPEKQIATSIQKTAIAIPKIFRYFSQTLIQVSVFFIWSPFGFNLFEKRENKRTDRHWVGQ